MLLTFRDLKAITATRLVIMYHDVLFARETVQIFWKLLCKAVVRSADTVHCIRAIQHYYYYYYCFASQSLRASWQSLLLFYSNGRGRNWQLVGSAGFIFCC